MLFVGLFATCVPWPPSFASINETRSAFAEAVASHPPLQAWADSAQVGALNNFSVPAIQDAYVRSVTRKVELLNLQIVLTEARVQTARGALPSTNASALAELRADLAQLQQQRDALPALPTYSRDVHTINAKISTLEARVKKAQKAARPLTNELEELEYALARLHEARAKLPNYATAAP